MIKAKSKRLLKIPTPQECTKEAGLRYVSDSEPGIKRIRAGKGFIYKTPEGRTLRDKAHLDRIRHLVIPPAWTDVWICPRANGHLQASGRDSRGRKQYRYHIDWRRVRDETKFDKMLWFGHALPKVREKISCHLSLRGLPREKVLATVVRLLETTLIRVGNEEYAKQNDSFGLTTMQVRHVRVDGADIQFKFRGKSGIQHAIQLHDRRLAKIISSCQCLPGQELFQYMDEKGVCHSIDSTAVNGYLREIAGQEFTAKDFRTWFGTVFAMSGLIECDEFTSVTQAKRNVVRAVEAVAQKLGNTKAVCRKCYIHPRLIDCYLQGKMQAFFDFNKLRSLDHKEKLANHEAAILSFLQRLAAEQRAA